MEDWESIISKQCSFDALERSSLTLWRAKMGRSGAELAESAGVDEVPCEDAWSECLVDNDEVVVVGRLDGVVEVWDTNLLQQIGEPNNVYESGVTFTARSGNEKCAMMASYGEMAAWDSQNLERIYTAVNTSTYIYDICFLRECDIIYCGGDRGVTLVDLKCNDTEPEPQRHDDCTAEMSFSACGSPVFSVSLWTIQVRGAGSDGVRLIEMSKEGSQLVFSPFEGDSEKLFVSDLHGEEENRVVLKRHASSVENMFCDR